MSQGAVASDRPPQRSRARLAALAAALLLVAAIAHVAWWSWPRAHATRPDPGDLPGRLLATDRLPVALWVAYPHQNLATLAGAVGRDDGAAGWLAALARRTELPVTELPGFGPFPAPPARELAAASDLAGERVVIAARVEPVFALVSRLAGAIAGNPWLAGGEVDAFGGRAEVTWDGTLWMVSNLAPAELAAVVGPRTEAAGSARPLLAGDPALAALRLDRPLAPLPAGLHVLRTRESGLMLATERAPDLASGRGAGDGEHRPDPAAAAPDGAAGVATLPDQVLERWGVSLLVLSGPEGPLGAAGALALFRDTGGARQLGPFTFQVPAIAVWHRPGERSFSLPGASLLSRLGLGGGQGGGWGVTATSDKAEGRARAITPALAPLLARLHLGLWADPRPALATVDDVADFLETVPLAGREEAQRWRDWQVLLAPLAACDRLALEIRELAVEIEVTGCRDR